MNVKLESLVSSGHTEEPEPIGETSTTGTRQRVKTDLFLIALLVIFTDISKFLLRIDETLE